MKPTLCYSLSFCCAIALSGCTPQTPVEEVRPASADAGRSQTPIATGVDDWPSWRGSYQNGVAPAQNVPTEFSESNGVLWKTDLPGLGHASPTVVGNRIYLATADDDQQTQSLVAISKETGDIEWEKTVLTGGLPDPGDIHNKSSHASATVACDGSAVYGVFLNNNTLRAVSLDLAGEQRWNVEVGPFIPRHGFGSSPVLYEGLLIVAAEHEGGGYLAGLSRETGDTVWRIIRETGSSYCSPVVAEIDGKDQLLMSGGRKIVSYNPLTGEEYWSVDGCAQATVGSPVCEGTLVFASGGYPETETVCVDAASAQLVWSNKTQIYVPSMLVHDGHLYAVDNKGIAYCWQGSNGELKWKERLCRGTSSSPVLVGDNIYMCDERGSVYVFKGSPAKLDVVAENQLGDIFYSSPAIVGDRLYLRASHGTGPDRTETLFCIGSRAESL